MTYDKVIFLKIRKIYLLLNACVHCYFIDSIWDPFLDLRAVFVFLYFPVFDSDCCAKTNPNVVTFHTEICSIFASYVEMRPWSCA